jgi:hypothetical protein
LIERNELIDLRRFPASPHLQIGQNDCALAILLKKNKRIARPEFRGIKHVRVDVALPYDKFRFAIRGIHN